MILVRELHLKVLIVRIVYMCCFAKTALVHINVTEFSTVVAVDVLESIDVHRLSASTVRGASSGFLVSVGCFGLNDDVVF